VTQKLKIHNVLYTVTHPWWHQILPFQYNQRILDLSQHFSACSLFFVITLPQTCRHFTRWQLPGFCCHTYNYISWLLWMEVWNQLYFQQWYETESFGVVTTSRPAVPATNHKLVRDISGMITGIGKLCSMEKILPHCCFVLDISLICDNSVTAQNLWFFRRNIYKGFEVLLSAMSAMMTQLLSSGEFCKLCYDTIPVQSASANVSFYTNNSKMPNFELWHSCCKWVILCKGYCRTESGPTW
jgi:hypothetical protein